MSLELLTSEQTKKYKYIDEIQILVEMNLYL